MHKLWEKPAGALSSPISNPAKHTYPIEIFIKL
jgi:hypothetical protein